jgi:hypothetical protein
MAWLALIASASAASSVEASALPRYGTFTYSSLCWDKEGGDAGGVRFALTRSRTGVSLVYEYGNGPLEGARITRLTVLGDRIEAEASTSDGDITLSAELGPKRARYAGPFAGKPGEARLIKRIKRFKQKIPACR